MTETRHEQISSRDTYYLHFETDVICIHLNGQEVSTIDNKIIFRSNDIDTGTKSNKKHRYVTLEYLGSTLALKNNKNALFEWKWMATQNLVKVHLVENIPNLNYVKRYVINRKMHEKYADIINTQSSNIKLFYKIINNQRK